MIYTCYEMVRDCRANRPEGWNYFVANYVPVIRKLVAHYFPERAADRALTERVLVAIGKPESSMFSSLDPAPERVFVSELRQKVMEAVEADVAGGPPGIVIDLETLLAAIDPLTLVEKQVVWLEAMRYDPPATGRMMRADPKTVEKIRQKAADLIRGRLDSWKSDLLGENGPRLGREAAELKRAECLPPKAYLDVLDGRTTWRGRDEMERHIMRCGYCLDHFCRMVEVVDLLRGSQPLNQVEAEPFRTLLGIEAGKASVWRRVFSG